ncbi:MAG: 1-(5-phosphoribosyl)-5-[(5-phosphoribosylamino)methylideneamino]imidazole-4-carboxamide isomerase [Candidatus Auribacter fodinae]|jgi:phosphoribosylformimino-5-aminoimidazole carboxamide ribotide isomerase|uniref:1-(5-phosphoribosyl)-5-[(5-phosphoribosylamino)methylideneamino] imidazole-4-carboxamide isomerase n=1 Tax=Candidatus Auribacter fodinae TaxID=2093366 RepID=A0A3A4R5B6_9BACT|nr:MAG: 1-(5-phosphoribosyl)-5-[(5-phosphoribosylamino)methylideneamino]imidazole-4-carboxamide isomerase [Candidatus Auribacter fodinae]
MIIIPAIDLRDGKCVRLTQGRADKQTVFSDSPAEVAKRWQDAGAQRLHVVDLEGAFEGTPKNASAVEQIRHVFDGIIEFGGGIRTTQDIDLMIGTGVDRIILGTKVYQSHDFVKQCISIYGDMFIAGIDAKDGMVAIKGWVETTDISAVELARSMETLGIKEIIFTDIACDGMMAGPNIKSLKEVLQAVKISVIASGGISNKTDLNALAQIGNKRLTGAIIGKALYTGDINLQEVIECWQNV